MRKRLGMIFVAIVLVISACTISVFSVGNDVAYATGNYVYLGGYPTGISICADGLIVLEVTDVQTDFGTVCPLKNANIQKGDILQKIDGQTLTSVYQLKKLVGESDEDIELTVKYKDGTVLTHTVSPAMCVSNEKKLGVIVKEDVSGIGTVTFVTLDGRFGALGHHVIDVESGLGEELRFGKIYNTFVEDVIKGEKGKAGGLVASLNKLSAPIGDIRSNTNIGIYGLYNGTKKGELIEISELGQATLGKAKIYTTIEGESPQWYDIEIVKSLPQNTPQEKGLVIVVRDQRLIEKTGGIVQGMSGSPIVQNGKLIGAVTHVFVGDATRGYGVHAKFMYEQAYKMKIAENKKAA